jgi:ADP-ribose pyrophosphatase YjhB (NUDIX family)
MARQEVSRLIFPRGFFPGGGWMDDAADRLPTMVTVFGALVDGDSVLTFRRASEPHKGALTLPGGHKKRGESLAEACAREVLEETGLTMLEPRFLGFMEFDHPPAPRDYLSFYFRSTRFSGVPTAGPEGTPGWSTLAGALADPDCHQAFAAVAPFLLGSGGPFHGRALIDDRGRGAYSLSRLTAGSTFF